METEDLDGNYKIGASSEYYDICNSELNLLESDINKFDELKTRRNKIMELKKLMFEELQGIKAGYSIDPSIETYEKSNKGYPSLFKNDHLIKKYSLNKISDFRQNMTAILQRICEGTSTEDDDSSMDSMMMKILNIGVCHNQAESKVMNFHLNKAKEIRRLQYVNELYKKQKLTMRVKKEEPISPDNKVRFISRGLSRSRSQTRSKSPFYGDIQHKKDWRKHSKVVQDETGAYIVTNPQRTNDINLSDVKHKSSPWKESKLSEIPEQTGPTRDIQRSPVKVAQERVREERGDLYKPIETFSSTQDKIDQMRYIKKLENDLKDRDQQLAKLTTKECAEKVELD